MIRTGATRFLTLVALFATLVGCGNSPAPPRSPFKTIDITGSAIGQELRLTDHNGTPRTLESFRGKIVLVTFGFTNCPDVCPTTLSDLSTAVRKLGADGASVQVLFVTVDPRRDTPELLRQYVPAFHPSFLGLWGDPEAIARASQGFKVHAAVRPAGSADHYTVDHSAQSFAFDRQGRIRLYVPYGTDAETLVADLRLLLNS